MSLLHSLMINCWVGKRMFCRRLHSLMINCWVGKRMFCRRLHSLMINCWVGKRMFCRRLHSLMINCWVGKRMFCRRLDSLYDQLLGKWMFSRLASGNSWNLFSFILCILSFFVIQILSCILKEEGEAVIDFIFVLSL